MLDLMLVIAEDLDRYLEKETMDNGKVLKLKEVCASFTTDMIGSTVFGLRVNSLEDSEAPFRQFARKMFDFNDFIRSIELFHIFFMPSLTKYTGARFFSKEGSVFLRSIFWDIVNERMASGEKRNDLIDILIEMQRAHENQGDLGGFTFNGDDLVAQAAIFFTAGFETSSTTISFSLYELALNEEIQTTLRKEIREALKETDGKITYELITTLPYLHMVVSETLRKYPPVAFVDRVVTTDYKIPNSDLVIEEGTPVYISMMGLHYDPEYFPEPEKYDPMRFSEERKKTRPAFTHLPFGEGPRVCIEGQCTYALLASSQTRLNL
ncbi:cytochrome P450 6k1 [Nomia melanderi]|uniref:cytochrome P450 6k1 n=1 Tax=Nomia melanderi TaxID=2448451 RepID=UPI003FCD2FD2